MIDSSKMVFVSHDIGLLGHWQRAFNQQTAIVLATFHDLIQLQPTTPLLVWLDLAVPDIPQWNHPSWANMLKTQQLKVIATNSFPKDADAIQALDAGCSGYCHAFSDVATLIQIKQVVEAGHIWIGKTLMQRLIQSACNAAPSAEKANHDWGAGLSPREREVAILAANGASNQKIAQDCKISERTVKAHLSAAFEKLNLTDRLQLALRVHGIH